MDVLGGIRDLDFGWLEERVVHAKGWSSDEAWHHHILDTRRYAEDCQAVFGTLLHHEPGLTGEELERAWKTTLQAYSEHFPPKDLAVPRVRPGRGPSPCG